MTRRRAESIHLTSSAGTFIIRDQKPMSDQKLEACLTDMAVPDWYRTLNSRVFLWAGIERVERLLAARQYRNSAHLVLTIDTKKLVEKYQDKLELSPINSGSTLFNPARRGPGTFLRLSDHPADTKVVEVTVKYSIPEIKDSIDSHEVIEPKA